MHKLKWAAQVERMDKRSLKTKLNAPTEKYSTQV